MSTCLGGEVDTCHWGSRGRPLLTVVVTATLLGVIHPSAQREALLSRYCPGREFRDTRFQAGHNPDYGVFAVSPHIPGLSFCPYIRGVVLDGGFQSWLPLESPGELWKNTSAQTPFQPHSTRISGVGSGVDIKKKALPGNSSVQPGLRVTWRGCWSLSCASPAGREAGAVGSGPTVSSDRAAGFHRQWCSAWGLG